MTRKSGFLGFGEGDDFAEGRAGAGGRKEGLREEAREKARGAVGGRRVRGEQASGSVREDDGAGRAEVGGPWGTKKELRGDQHLRSRQDIQPDHASQSTFGQANNIPRDYFLCTSFKGFMNVSWKADCLSVQRVTMSTTLFSNDRTSPFSILQSSIPPTVRAFGSPSQRGLQQSPTPPS